MLKLSEETSIVPERQLLAELTEIVLVSIEFEKVTEMSTLAETEVALSDGKVDIINQALLLKMGLGYNMIIRHFLY